jgi:hypothetical protein
MDCCNGTGLADFAAVPCPNPDCPAQRREHAVSNLERYDPNDPVHRLREFTEATSVRAEVFKPGGKWMYSVKLDYSRTAEIEHLPSHYINPVEAAVLALKTATQRGTSEVIFDHLYADWHMFVPDPPNGWPIMVTGGFFGD